MLFRKTTKSTSTLLGEHYRSFGPEGTSNVGCARTFGPALQHYCMCAVSINGAPCDFHEVCPVCDVPLGLKLRYCDTLCGALPYYEPRSILISPINIHLNHALIFD